MNIFDVAAMPESVRNALSAQTFKAVINKQDDAAELLIFSGIGKDPWTGEGVNASDVAAFLSQNRTTPVNVRINSPGGLAFDGITIHNALIQHDAPVSTTVEGMAASAATIISLASAKGGKARMFENATYFIHRAMGVGVGNVDVMAEVSDWLNRIDEQIARTYAAKTGKRYDQMLKLMAGAGKADGTIFSAKEALTMGLIDEVIPLKGARNEVDHEAIRNRLNEVNQREAAERQKEVAARLVSMRLHEVN
jgi:ATP-dependent protease ClpP protease subunit